MSASIGVHVECYSGYRGDQLPLRFFFGQRKIKVQEILDQWQGPDYRYFKLAGDDGATYILRHDENQGAWELTMFDSGQAVNVFKVTESLKN